MLRDLLVALWPTPPESGLFTFARFREKPRGAKHFPIQHIHEFDDQDLALLKDWGAGYNVYYGLGARANGLSESRFGRQKSVVALPAFALDIDFFDPENPGAHKAKNLPRDISEAAYIFEDAPEPSAVVHTGNGVQLLWFFKEPIQLPDATRRTQVGRAFAAFQEPMQRKAEEKGHQLDATGQIQRIWRAPGFIHQKTGRESYLWHCDPDIRYSLDDLNVQIPKRREEKRAEKSILKSLRSSLERIDGDPANGNPYYENVQKMLRGESFAERGKRDKVMQGIGSTIGWMPAFRDKDPRILAEIGRSSLEHWAAEEDATKTVEEELEKFADKIERAQSDYEEKHPPGEYEEFCKDWGIEPGSEEFENMDPEELAKNSIISYGSHYYIYDYTNKSYWPGRPRTKTEIGSVIREAWTDAPPDVELTYINKNDEAKEKSLQRVLDQYSTSCNEIYADLVISKSFYDSKSKIYHDAVCPIRVDPEFNPQIDEWVRLLAGPHYEVLADWMASLPKLKKPCPGLYLEGPSGCGKTLFALGVAKLWTKGSPSDFNQMKEFNAQIEKCPLVWIEEGISLNASCATTQLRKYIGGSGFKTNEKNLPVKEVSGYVRVLVTANNPNVLAFGNENLSVGDVDALRERFLYLKANRVAAEWFEKYNKDQRMTKSWVDADGLAKHCLYLSETRTVSDNHRFLVPSKETEWHRSLAMTNDKNAPMYDWVVRFASNPKLLEDVYKTAGKRPRAYIGNGFILVNAQGVTDNWREPFTKEQFRAPTTKRVGDALGTLTLAVSRIKQDGQILRFRVLKPEMILDWSRRYQIGSEDAIRENLARALSVPPEDILSCVEIGEEEEDEKEVESNKCDAA